VPDYLFWVSILFPNTLPLKSYVGQRRAKMEIEHIRYPDAPEGIPPIATRAGDFIFYPGAMASHPITGLPPEISPPRGFPYHFSSIDRQLRYIFGNMSATLEAAGSSIKRGMKSNVYHTNPKEIDQAYRVRKDYFGIESPPPHLMVLVAETPARGTSVIIDMVFLASDAKMDRQVPMYDTQKTPMPAHVLIYGYPICVQAAKGGGFVFTQGKAATKADGVAPEIAGHPHFPYRHYPIKMQAEYILNFYKSLFDQMGSSLENVVKADLYMTNMKDIAGLDEVWYKFFPSNPPARTISPVSLAVTDTVLEIELIAIDPDGPYRKETIRTPDAPKHFENEPQAIKAGPFLFLSEQLATDYKQGIAPGARTDPNFPFHSSSIKRQVNYILKNTEAICQAAGTSTKNLVRKRAMHMDLGELSEAETAWIEALGNRIPPTTTFRTAGPLPVPGCTVQYDLVAFIPSDS
jgi:enamine deaminase RidA (YjgF/YER057c/UK114 family)